MFSVPQMNFFLTCISVHGCTAKNSNRTKATWNAFHTCGSLPVSCSQSDFVTQKKSIAKKKSWENCLHVLSSPKSGNSSTSKVARPPVLTDKASVVGPCVDSSVHVPNIYLKVAFNWLLKNKLLDFPWIPILFMYWSRGLFLWMVQRKSRFRNLKRVHGTTQEFASGAFRSVLAKYFISVNSCSCTADEEKLRDRSFTVS